MDEISIRPLSESIDLTALDAAVESFQQCMATRDYAVEAPPISPVQRPASPMLSPVRSPTSAQEMSKSKALSLQRKHNVKAHDNWVTALAVGNGTIFSASWDKTIQVWDQHTMVNKGAMHAHNGRVRALALTGKYIFSGGDDNQVKAWGLRNLCCVASMKAHTGWVMSLDTSPRFLASGSADMTIQIWDNQGLVSLASLQGHTGAVNAVAWSGDGRLYSGASDGSIRSWDLSLGPVKATCQFTVQAHANWVWGLALDHEEGYIFSCADDDCIRVWNMENLAPREGQDSIVGHYNWVRCICISGNYVFSGGEDKTVKVWDKQTLRCVATVPGKGGAVHSIAALGDLVTAGTSENTVSVWGP